MTLHVHMNWCGEGALLESMGEFWSVPVYHFGISWFSTLEYLEFDFGISGIRLWNILNLRRDRCQSWSKKRF